jgi:anti-sigma B factor antagonist
MQLICTQERLLKIFRITGLAKVFAIHGSQAEALTGD